MNCFERAKASAFAFFYRSKARKILRGQVKISTMALLDMWDYVRSMGDRRLRKQGYVASGMGILERYRRVPGFWAPHLENNRRNLMEISLRLAESGNKGGTLLILGAGRLLDVPWEELFPLFERVVLFDADHCIVPYVERIIASVKTPVAKPLFEIGDLTSSVVDVAAWAEEQIAKAPSAAGAAKALAAGFDQAGTPQPAWARTFADVRLVVSTNLMSQLGYFPRLHIQNEFKKRFGVPFSKDEETAERLEQYFCRVRARHVYDIASLKNSWSYVSTDVDAITYELKEKRNILTETVPPKAGVELDSMGQVKFAWQAEITEHSDPLHKQKVKELWPKQSRVEPPKRWVWHIVPQGAEKKYQTCGRVHIIEAWTRRPD
jgi:hypothetical protein